ncbi:hypothetical protein NW759_002340 [Fusarium solani]|nr:hypothetical protein NW759_002340 [Fusarium solani]
MIPSPPPIGVIIAACICTVAIFLSSFVQDLTWRKIRQLCVASRNVPAVPVHRRSDTRPRRFSGRPALTSRQDVALGSMMCGFALIPEPEAFDDGCWWEVPPSDPR